MSCAWLIILSDPCRRSTKCWRVRRLQRAEHARELIVETIRKVLDDLRGRVRKGDTLNGQVEAAAVAGQVLEQLGARIGRVCGA